MTNLLVIGGPAEGRMFEETSVGILYVPEMKPIKFYEADELTIDQLMLPNYIKHTYRVQKLMHEDKDGRVWTQKIYLHDSLDFDAGLHRLKEFLMKQFMMMEM